MKKKIGKMNEAAWVLGTVLCALGIALCTKADFGLSMVAAPAYILNLALGDKLTWLTQGIAEYIVQGIALVVLMIAVRRFKLKYVFSFLAVMVFGFVLDLWLIVFGGNGAYTELWQRVLAFVIGECITGLAIAFFFRTTLPLQVWELIVCELSDRFGWDINKVKRIFDITMFVLSAVMAILLTGGFNGFGIGTVVLTIFNAPIIKLWGKLLDRIFEFDPLVTLPDKKEKVEKR